MPTIEDFQKNLSRRPLVEIIASTFQNDIPFDGVLLTQDEENETHPVSIIHSNGRMITAFKRIPDNPTLDNELFIMKITDINRQEFQATEIEWETKVTLSEIKRLAIIELYDGRIAVLWWEYKNGSPDWWNYARIMDSEGNFDSEVLIDSWNDTETDVTGLAIFKMI